MIELKWNLPECSDRRISMADRVTLDFLTEKLGVEVASVKHTDLEKMGGMSAEMVFIDVLLADGETLPMVVKTAAPGNSLKIGMGLAREALFYTELGPSLAGDVLLKCYYAEGDMGTGEMLVLMERAEGAVPAGTFFGPLNPNNWGVRDKLDAMCEGNPFAVEISQDAFKLYAKMHAKYWMDPGLLNKSWLKGSDWQQSEGELGWQGLQQTAVGAWGAIQTALEEGTSQITWDPHLVACLTASFGKANWDAYQAELTSRPFTLVQGDCHPHNALWTHQRTEDAKVKLIDFECVSVGSPPQEIGQWMISHMEPATRASSERDLLKAYHAAVQVELRQAGKDAQADLFTFESCWLEYVAGGAGRWIWLLVVMVNMVPPTMGQYFHDVVAAFLHDHIPNPTETPMPRV